jgi:hypothetical protein
MKIPKLIIALLLVATSCYAADNSTYIDQSGDNANILVVQDGAGNQVRGLPGSGTSKETPAKIYGDNNQVQINQIGSGNTLSFGIVTSAATGDNSVSEGNLFNYIVKGNSATAIINSNGDGKNTSAGNVIDIQQTGNAAQADINVLGSANRMFFVTDGGASNSVTGWINGDKNIQDVTISGGGYNSINILQTGLSNSVTGGVIGYGNGIRITQDGYGHSARLDIIGNTNQINVAQYGMGDATPLNIILRGDRNTYSMTTR